MLQKASYDIIETANDIVDILNINQAEIKINFEKVGIEKILAEFKDMYLDTCIKQKIDFKIRLDKNVPSIIVTDYQRLKQIIVNLLKNAFHCTNGGSIILDVTIFTPHENLASNNVFTYTEQKFPVYNILFKVKDTGSGISNEKKKFIEKILGISDSPNVDQTQYGGFGLLISRWLCYLLGGNMWFKSEIDMGTIFYFNILCEGLSI
jgi:two-component system chemotaxis sensor kinase CheA